MTGDFTRDTFRPAKGYSAVRMQQGRLLTDADWNEQGDIQRHALRTTTRSVIGASGFPEDNPGFAILNAAAPALVIGGGEAYVDGTRLDYPAPARLQLKRISGTGAATIWQLEAGARVRAGDQLVVQGSTLAQSVRVSTLQPDVAGRQQFQCAAALSPNATVTVDRYHGVENQPFHPPVTLPAALGDYLFYLDVWERPIGTGEDPLIRETAFGGPDTAGRDQTVWQVKVAALADLVSAGALTLPASCKSFGPGWTPFGNAVRGRMAARAEAVAAAADPCALPTSGGYRSLENHLYRIEIHNGGTIGTATVKWSRDNAIHVSRYGAKDNVALIVDSIGRDAQSALTKDDWIEILDEARQLAGRPGYFARISDVNGNRVSLGEILHPDTLAPITASNLPDLSVLPSAGMVRRWEGGAPVKIAADAWKTLENGVQVSFTAGRYAGRDHWLVPARSISASIEWPADEATGAAALLPPAGIAHHYCALALGTLSAGNVWTLTDCRSLFPPLTALRSFLYLGGDGQEAMPDPLNPATRIELDAKLRVGVVRGRTPVAGAMVEFAITTGDGRLGPVADNLTTRKVPTGADGVAKLAWSLDATTQAQQVTARLLDGAGTPTHAPIVFTATLSRAAEVSFDPANTPELAGENTVQGAIEKLASMKQIGCSTYVIVEGSDWVSVLEGLVPGEDAAICFQRGTYETDRTVTLKGMGHLTVSGAGSGTRIVAKRNECALRFESCTSVTLHDLDVSAPDGTGALEPIAGRLGTVTIVDCPEVDVTDLDLRCGAGITADRTCLTIAGLYEAPKDNDEEGEIVDRPLDSVRVLRNRLWVGMGQDGVLVSHAINTLVADNEIEVIAGKQNGLRPGRRFEEKGLRRKLVAVLISDPKPGKGRGGDGKKRIKAGDFEAEFESLVPQGEWDALVEANPPTQAEARSQRGLEKYLERLADLILEEPKRLPSFDDALETLGGRVGGARMGTIEPEVKRTLAFSSDPQVGRFEAPAAGEGKVLVEVNGTSLEFGSPINQADWNSAMRLMPIKGNVNATELLRHIEKVATRILADEKFRERLGSARSWFERLTSDLPAHGRQAITCGGKTLDEVTVRGNRVYGFIEGVHIGTSFKAKADAPMTMSKVVSVSDNNLYLRKPSSEVYCPMGLFVGNVQTVRIERNVLDWAGNSMADGYSNGIRVWGHIGRYLMISENRIATAYVGIRVRRESRLPDEYWNSYLWVAADNLVENVPPERVVRGPPFLRSRDNRPIP